ncbi:CAP Gly-rich domain [Trinorchestia longiramus]|nr:CAP Gly-rich domain [Trinorchestia longiramus]
MSDSAIKAGNKVKLVGKDIVGEVAYVGNTKFATGKWVGVVLEHPNGRNNGTVEGTTYFKCEDKHGLFVRQTQLECLDGSGDDANRSGRQATTPSSAPRSSAGKRRIEPTSLRRKPQGNPVPQKPDRLRLPIAGGGSGMTPALRRTPSSGTGWRQSDNDLMKGGSTKASTPGSKETSPKTADLKRMSASFVEMSPEEPVLSQLAALDAPLGFVENRSPAAAAAAAAGGGSAAARQEERVNLQELENLRSEVKDLNEKLETLRIKRAQDKDKLKEGEKLRLQVEQLTENKARLMENLGQLQKELVGARNEARDAAESRNQTVEDTQDLADTVEMLTLDKEMAEERAETLQLELEQARELIEELTVDLEILKEASSDQEAQGGGGITEAPTGATVLQVKQLEQQNQRLHETLVKMRDLTAHEKHEMQKLTKELEARKTEIGVAARAKEHLEQELTQCRAQVADLQEQVDAALGAEEMVETLTERNLELEEQVMELEEQVRDLEDINYTNDLLVEGAKEQELELREDLDLNLAKLREVERERDALGAVVVDRDATITKFRELVQTLTDQNTNLRNELTKATNRPVGTPSEVIDFKKLFTETKAHSAAIDLELRELELQQARDHVTYLKQYLPDNFMTRGGDQDAVNLLLLLPRVIWKADVVLNGVQKFSEPETIDRPGVLKTHAVDQFAFACRLQQLLHTVQSCVHQLQHAASRGTVEQFLALGGLYPELAAHERAIDQYLEMLRKDQLDENVGLELLERVVASVVTLENSHLQSAKLHQPTLLLHLTRAVAAAAHSAAIDAKRIQVLMAPSEEENEVAVLCKTVLSKADDITGAAKRIKRRLPQDGSAGPISFSGEVQNTLRAAGPSMGRAATALRHVARACLQQISLSGENEGITGGKVKELLHEATDVVYGGEDQGPESIKASLVSACDHFSLMASCLEKGEYDYDGTPEETNDTPPIVQRAQNIKAELKDSEHIKHKLESREQDLRDLRLLMKQKNEELSEMMVRRDLAEKKLVNATKDANATIDRLQRKVDDTAMLLRRKEKEYEETMDHLQSDIDSLEVEKGELREKLKNIKKRSLYESMDEKTATAAVAGVSLLNLSSSSVNNAAPQSAGLVQDSPALLQQIKDLQTALRSATAANTAVRTSKMRQQLAELPPLPVTSVSGLEKRDLTKDERTATPAKEQHDRLNSLMHQTAQLKKELHKTISSALVVDLRQRRPGQVPVTATLEPKHHLQHERNTLLAYRASVAAAQTEVMRAFTAQQSSGTINTTLTSFPSTHLAKLLQNKDSLTKVGEVRVGSGAEVSTPIILDVQSLHKLHSRLLS